MMNAKIWIVPVLASLGLTTVVSAQEPGAFGPKKPTKSIRLRTGGQTVQLPKAKADDDGAVTIQKIVDFTTSGQKGLFARSPGVNATYWTDLEVRAVDMPAVSMVFELEGEGYVVSVDGDDGKLIVDGKDVTEARLKKLELPMLFSTTWRNADGETVADIDKGGIDGEVTVVGGEDAPIAIYSTSTLEDGRFPGMVSNQRRNVMDASGDAIATVSRTGAGLNLRFLPRSKRAWLGVEVQPVTSALAEHLQIDADGSCLVSAVRKDSPAKKAGLEVNDLIIRIDDDQVADSDSLIELMATRQPGDEVTVTVIRKGEVREMPLKLGRAKNSFFADTPRFGWTDLGTRMDMPGFPGVIQLDDITTTPFQGTIQGGGDDPFQGTLRIDGEPFVIETQPKGFPGMKGRKDVETRLSEMEKTLAEMRALMEALLKGNGKKD